MKRPRHGGPPSWAMLAATLAALAALAGAPARAATPVTAAAADSLVAPAGFDDLQAWLDHRFLGHHSALPIEARIFYRRALALHDAGSPDEAMRLARGAAELDPHFIAPHVSLASWNLFRDPSQSLLHWSSVLERARDSFRVQLAMVAALGWGLTQALYLAILALGLLIVVVHQASLRHAIEERLARWCSQSTARWWPWLFLLLPFLAGLGPVLPTLALLGLLWPTLKGRQRVVPVLLVVAAATVPLAAPALDRLALPLREDRAPFHGFATLEDGRLSAERQARFAALAARHRDDPFVQFAHGWLERQSGRPETAEAAFRAVLAAWPDDADALTNLGNAVFVQGRPDEALELYQRAIEHDPANAAAHFNLSQVHTLRYDFHAANTAIAQASAIDFDLVRSAQSRATADGVLPLVDPWPSPDGLWGTLLDQPAASFHGAMLPPLWRGRPEAGGWRFSVAAVLAFGLAVAAGVALGRQLPLRTCSNCGRIVCRRCAQRRREFAFCPGCATVEARAENPDFARVLLLQHRRKVQSGHRVVRILLAILVPGYGMVSLRRVFVPLALLATCAALVGGALDMAAPFSMEPRVAPSESLLPAPVAIAAWIGVYLVSILGFLAAEARSRALSGPTGATRARPTQATAAQRAAA